MVDLASLPDEVDSNQGADDEDFFIKASIAEDTSASAVDSNQKHMQKDLLTSSIPAPPVKSIEEDPAPKGT